MAAPNTEVYEVERRETVAETDALRVRILTLAAGQEVPWHYHSQVTDTFYCWKVRCRWKHAPREHTTC